MAANHFLSTLGNANAEMLDFHAPLSATVVAHVTVNALMFSYFIGSFYC